MESASTAVDPYGIDIAACRVRQQRLLAHMQRLGIELAIITQLEALRAKGAQYLYVVYTPYASQKTTGVTENPIDGGPWIMYPGKPWAHLMIAPQKSADVKVR